MRSDWTIKVLLGLMTISLWALTITQVGTPSASAIQGAPTMAPPSEAVPRATLIPGPATLPLRWHVPNVTHEFANSSSYCGTSIVVTNPTNTAVTLQVEYFNGWSGNSIGYVARTLSAGLNGSFWVHGSPDYVSLFPFDFGSVEYVDTGEWDGRATVHASHPQIMVTAYMVCRSDKLSGQPIVAITDQPTFAVGATAGYFQAGMPVNWTPPLAEVPE